MSMSISANYLASIESGKAFPSRATVEKIVEALSFDENFSRCLLGIAALEKHSRIEDEELPQDVRFLIYEIRQRSSSLPPEFVAALRTSVRGAADLNCRRQGDKM